MSYLVEKRSGAYKIDVKISEMPPITPSRASYRILVDRVVAEYSLSSDASNYWVCWAVLIYGMKYDNETGRLMGEVCEEIRPEVSTWLNKFIDSQAPMCSA